MKTFLEYFEQRSEVINEALITFGGKSYPKFGNIVIMAGGAGSGKGFIQSKLMGIEGITLDVDRIKELAIGSKKLAKAIKDETGYDIKNFDLKNPENVSTLHTLLSDVYGTIDKHQKKVFVGIHAADPSRKPNLIFDVTLKDIGKLYSIVETANQLGYDKKNIHIVWVMNDVKVAIKQNKERSRTVPENILIGTHTGATTTMAFILNKGEELRKYLDGDIWIAFNKRGVDQTVKTSDKGGMYIVDANYIKVKSSGKAPKKVKELESEIVKKVKSYAPHKSKFE